MSLCYLHGDREEGTLATKKSFGAGGGAGGGKERERPKIHTSHEKAARGGAKRTASADRRGRPPVGALASAPGGPRVKKAKPAPRGAASATPSSSVASDRARDQAIAIAIAAIEKKAVGIEILDVAGKVDYADFLVIMTGRSDRQVQALAQGIEDALKKKGTRPLAIEGLPHASWVLMDFGDVVVHVFQDDARSLYDIEGLWMDARRIPVPVPEAER